MIREHHAIWRSEVAEVCREFVFARASAELQFNPYSDCDASVEVAGAADIRRENLVRYLEAIGSAPEVVVVAEAPGPWGCRFSGVPITSESQLVASDFPVDGRRTSRRDAPYTEYSASIFWRVMLPFFPRFLVWNALPFHPHRADEPLSIRTPRVSELRSFESVTELIVRAVRPRAVVALGRKAQGQLAWSGIDCRYVRHPSQGGARDFEAGMIEIFSGLG